VPSLRLGAAFELRKTSERVVVVHAAEPQHRLRRRSGDWPSLTPAIGVLRFRSRFRRLSRSISSEAGCIRHPAFYTSACPPPPSTVVPAVRSVARGGLPIFDRLRYRSSKYDRCAATAAPR
jgi:hypothetical protein